MPLDPGSGISLRVPEFLFEDRIGKAQDFVQESVSHRA